MVAAQRKMISAAERTIFALDHSKFGRKALALTTGFDPRLTIVTDCRPDAAIAQTVVTAGARLLIAAQAAAHS